MKRSELLQKISELELITKAQLARIRELEAANDSWRAEADQRYFKVGDRLEHHLIGTVTEEHPWGVSVEAVDQLKPGSEPEKWSINAQNDLDWHLAR